MKQAKKIVALLLCAALLVGATIAGTLAYLTSTDSVTNTFTVGNVAITMVESVVNEYGEKTTGTTESGNVYKLIPGHTYTKDPTIKVSAGSEDCYIFVKIENGLETDGAITMETGWSEVTGHSGVWVYGTETAPASVAANGQVTPFKSFTFANNADPETYKDKSIVVTAYAIQANNLGENDTAAEIWTLFSTNSGN